MTDFAIHFYKVEVNVCMNVNVALFGMNETMEFKLWQISRPSLTFLFYLEK